MRSDQPQTSPRAAAAAHAVEPMMLAMALDHIAKVAAASRTSTRRIRWIEQRAIFALEGREYRDQDLDLPKSAPVTLEKMSMEQSRLRALNAELLSLLQDAVDSFKPHIEGGDDEWLRFAAAAIAKTAGSAS